MSSFFQSLFNTPTPPSPPTPPPPDPSYLSSAYQTMNDLWSNYSSQSIPSLEGFKTHLWENKTWVGGVAVVATLVAAIYFRNRQSSQKAKPVSEIIPPYPVLEITENSIFYKRLTTTEISPNQSDKQKPKQTPENKSASPSPNGGNVSTSSSKITDEKLKGPPKDNSKSTTTSTSVQTTSTPVSTSSVTTKSTPGGNATNTVSSATTTSTQIAATNDPQPPLVETKYALNAMELVLTHPHPVPPPKINLIFCIDTSNSMNLGLEKGDSREYEIVRVLGDGVAEVRYKDNPKQQRAKTTKKENEKVLTRADAVKQGTKAVLRRAQDLFKTEKDASVNIAIVTFATNIETICEPTKLTKSGSVMNGLIAKIDEYKSDGSNTDMWTGLERAVQKLNEMVKSDRDAKHILILLTDGNDIANREDLNTETREKLLGANALLYTIGIGKGHNDKLLKTLTSESNEDSFTGAYIDAGNDPKKIPQAISGIFDRALAAYKFRLESTKELAGHWIVNREKSKEASGKSVCELGDLLRGKMVKNIKIQSKHLKEGETIDLSKVNFNLVYTDPKGKKGTIPLPWQVNPVMNQAIAKGTKIKD